ncbi:MAG TPA: sigma-70 family RNA polymerase sigma factor [Pseudolabrys sp.]|nr:sigma-70 family RNA polymerase sigma factor [Pseudolabrys sp.]
MTSELAQRRFLEVVLPHLDDAYALAKWLTGNATDAEDVVQDACVRALRALETASVERPRPWTLAIVRNVAFTWLAKNRPKMLLVNVEDDADTAAETVGTAAPTPEEALIAAVDRDRLRAAIAALPHAFRETLVMREINGLSYRDIAETVGVPVGTVMSRLARARAILAGVLGRPE